MNLTDKFAESKVGEIHFDELHRILYSTDASDYSEKPLGVIYPKNEQEIQNILKIANENKIPVIPRGGGTSLAGQVVGNGLVVDISRYMTEILEINVEEMWARVQPGVIPDVLNQKLKPLNLFWGPETSTSNRNTLGGMVGNNSCGSHFPIYGSTRDHTLEVKGYLADGTPVHFKDISVNELDNTDNSTEMQLYFYFKELLGDGDLQQKIRDVFPKPSVKRRNHGYAVDILLDTDFFEPNTSNKFNLSKLVAGSEGTLLFITEIKLGLVSLPPSNTGVVVVHFNDIYEALEANILAMESGAGASELIDRNVLDLSKTNLTQSRNRSFISGDPEAILIIEFARETDILLDEAITNIISLLKERNLGYHFPVIKRNDINQVWEVRKAGLGLLQNLTGDERSVTVIEDSAVDIYDLPNYTRELINAMNNEGIKIITYAHAGSGELHFHPVINIKTEEGINAYKKVLEIMSVLVKKYRGSLSGEHGDGRLRGGQIPFMFGEEIYHLFQLIKKRFDPNGILNPGKIIDVPPMNTHLRFNPKHNQFNVKTYFDYTKDNGFFHSLERCNGSGECRKTNDFAGNMCPSYRATLDESMSTRARANALREILLNSTKNNPFDDDNLLEILSYCLSCKACKSECPSNVDITKLKAEFLQHYYASNGIPLSALLIAYLPTINKLMSQFPTASNYLLKQPFVKKIILQLLHFEPNAELPEYSHQTVLNFWQNNYEYMETKQRTIYLFADEFINYQEANVGIKAILLLRQLGYNVVIPSHIESGRTFLSKGLVKKAKKVATKNVKLLSKIISEKTPLVGLEPSAILSFRDEYPELVNDKLRDAAYKLSNNTYMLDEFIVGEFNAGRISRDLFTEQEKIIHLHTHCHHKALASSKSLVDMLQIPMNYKVVEINAGCCGMAGAFGYEEKTHKLSKKIGEMSLLPYVRGINESELLSANGVSCRHQINQNTDKHAQHPVEILFDALITKGIR